MKYTILSILSLVFLFGCQSEPVSTEESSVTQEQPIEKMEISSDQVKTTIDGDNKKMSISPEVPESNLTISSTAFEDNGAFPMEYTCSSTMPPLSISGVPASAKSLMIIASSPDERGEKTVHWTVWNIPAHIKSLNTDTIPERAIQGDTDFLPSHYRGPCPTVGTSAPFLFEIWALDKFIQEGTPEWTAGHLMINSMGSVLGKSVLHTTVSR